MAETHVLASPITFPTPPSVTSYEVIKFYINRSNLTAQSVLVAVRSNTGAVVEKRYEGAEAEAIISSLNTVNLGIKSLQKRILERLVADGVLGAGSVTGTPD